MYGAVCDREGDGYFAIMDTPALTAFSYMRCGTDGKTAYVPQLLQIGTNNYWAADRTVRYRFFESGGYVGMAKAYRQVAEEKGYAVTLREKAEKNPNILRSAGASRLDLAIEMSTVDLFLTKLKEAGVTNVMVKLSSMRNNIAYIQWEDLLDQGIYDVGRGVNSMADLLWLYCRNCFDLVEDRSLRKLWQLLYYCSSIEHCRDHDRASEEAQHLLSVNRESE